MCGQGQNTSFIGPNFCYVIGIFEENYNWFHLKTEKTTFKKIDLRDYDVIMAILGFFLVLAHFRAKI